MINLYLEKQTDVLFWQQRRKHFEEMIRFFCAWHCFAVFAYLFLKNMSLVEGRLNSYTVSSKTENYTIISTS